MTKYKVGNRILDGNITLDQIFENCTGDLAISIHSVKDKSDFHKDSMLSQDKVDSLIFSFRELLQYNKITAIKIVRTLTDWRLLEAKEFVESL